MEKLIGLHPNDGMQINTILGSVFLLMGIHPCIYASLMVPSARSRNNVRRFALSELCPLVASAVAS